MIPQTNIFLALFSVGISTVFKKVRRAFQCAYTNAHTLMAAMRGTGLSIRSDLGFIVLLCDTLTCGLEPGIKPLILSTS